MNNMVLIFFIQYNEIGAYSIWYNEFNFTDPSHPHIRGSWEFRDDYGVVFGRIYGEGLHSEYHEDSNHYWINSVLYNIVNATGVFADYAASGEISESSLGDPNGYFESIIAVGVYGPDRSNPTKNAKFFERYEKNSKHYDELIQKQKQTQSK